jgi:cytochrome c biogenesis protein CcmG/thiol:disulfide interchange protein DsbE
VNKKVLLIGLLLIVPLALLLRVGFEFDPQIVESPLIDKEAPRFALYDIDGNVHSMDDMLGKPIVINFWATYCPPCYAEHPLFLAASKRWRGEAHFLGVIYQDEPDLIRRWENQLGSWGPALVDEGGKMAIAYGVYGPPETFFVDRQGKIAYKVIGAVSPEQMESYLTALTETGVGG